MVPRGHPGEDATADDIRAGLSPAAVLVHGDTSSALGAALAAFHLRIPVVHVEAGLRAGTGNRTPFPEELNRRLIARIACLHLAPTATNQENLVRENMPDQAGLRDRQHRDRRAALGLRARRAVRRSRGARPRTTAIAASCSSRRTAARTGATGLRGIGEGVARLATAHPDVTFVLPLHPNPSVQQSLRPLLSARARTWCSASRWATASSRACWRAASS